MNEQERKAASDAMAEGMKRIEGQREMGDHDIYKVNKITEEGKRLAALIDVMERTPELDQHWVSIGGQKLKEALMCLKRAVERPEVF